MFRYSIFGVSAVVFSCVAVSALAETFTMKALPDDATAEPQIIGGRRSNPANWPATFVFSNCTSTALGPRVLLTAAHCVGNGANGVLKISGKNDIHVTCTHHPDYTAAITPTGGKTTSADWALCVAKADIPVKTFETVNTRSDLLKTDREILLTGFGCNKQGGVDGGYGVQYEGEANIKPVKNATEPDGLPKEINPPWARHYATTSGGAAVCYGDSGGAAYSYLDGAKQSRVVIGVNSRGDISKVSYLSAVCTGAFETWARQWAAGWAKELALIRLEICGINATTVICHP